MPNDIDIDEMLNYDPLDEAEKAFEGDPDAVMSAGLLAHMAHSEAKQHVLQNMNDTYFSMSWAEFKDAVDNSIFDFERVYSATRVVTGTYGDEEVTEEEIIWWDSGRSLMIFADSYGGKSTNHVEVVGVVKIKNASSALSSTRCSHGCLKVYNPETKEYEWSRAVEFNFDGREALFYKLIRLEIEIGFVEWENCPFLWLYNYSEGKQEPRPSFRHKLEGWFPYLDLLDENEKG